MSIVYSLEVPGGRCDVAFPHDEFAGRVMSVYNDGRYSLMEIGDLGKDPTYREAARRMGYGDQWPRYGVDHDITHHFVAHALGWPFSRVVWVAAHGGKRRPRNWGRSWPYSSWDEEHIVNRLQCFVMTGEKDTDYGILSTIWGDRLGAVAAHLSSWLRPWTAACLRDLPQPLNPEAVSHPFEEEEE